MIDQPAPTADSPAAQRARRLDRLCDRFEGAWKAGRRPSLERSLTKVPKPAQPELFRELLVLELEYRRQRGEKPEPEEYRLRFPAHAKLIDTVFVQDRPSAPSGSSLLRRWSVNRLANELRQLLFWAEGAGAQSAEREARSAAHQAQDGAASAPGSSHSALLFALLARLLGGASGEAALAGASGSCNTPLSPTRQRGDGHVPEDAVSCAPETPTQIGPPATLPNGSPPGKDCPPGTILGDYEILEKVGKGGMGIVYRARQRSANRIVALKVIRPDRLEELSAEQCQEWFERFRREGQIAAGVEHEHVVTVYEVGQAGGQLFYSMRFVEGQSLAEILRDGPLPNDRSALYMEQVAQALHVLHPRTVHRDVKPRNILIDKRDRPYLTDYGLAKSSSYTQGLTKTGSCMGTPEYMAPEQARNSESAGPASDIYSLGATFYELLTGRPPFRAADPVETLRQVQDEEPLSPRRINPAVHRDLELICLKCLQKEPHKRYASALDLAEELHRYRTGEPLRHTRAVTHAERVWRWGKRNPALAISSTLAVLALAASFAISVYLVLYQSGVATDNRLRLAEFTLDKGLDLCIKGEANDGVLWLARSLALAPKDARQFEKIVRINLSAWESRLSPLKAVLQHQMDGNGVLCAAFTSDGREILTGSREGVQRWEVATGEPVGPPLQPNALPIALAPDARIVLVSRGDALELLETGTGKAIGTKIPQTGFSYAAFGPDAETFVIGRKQQAQVWNVRTGKPVGLPINCRNSIAAVAIGPDGKVVATGSDDGTVQLWNIDTGGTARQQFEHSATVKALAFGPDGNELLTGSDDKTAQLWSLNTGKRLGPPFIHKEGVWNVSFSFDGQTLLTCSGNTCHLWDKKTRKPICPPLKHQGIIKNACFSPNSKMLLTASLDNTARLWEIAMPADRKLPHKDWVWTAQFSPDGERILTGSGCPDKKEGEGLLWEVAMGTAVGRPFEHQGSVRAVAFSPDGKTAVTGSMDGKVKIWDLSTGQRRQQIETAGQVLTLAVSPGGNAILTGCQCPPHGGCWQLWDAATGKLRLPTIPHRGPVKAVAFSPKGDSFLTVSADDEQAAYLWDAVTGVPLAPPLQHGPRITTALFNADGRQILTAGTDHTAKLWSGRTGKRLPLSFPHPGDVLAAAFDTDGNLLLTGCRDNVARVWETRTGRIFGRPLQHESPVTKVAFSPGGQLALTASLDFKVRIWDITTGRTLGPPLIHDDLVESVAFSPDGRTALTASFDKTARMRKVPAPMEDTPWRIMTRMKVKTGMEIGEDGLVHVMDAEAWKQLKGLSERISSRPESSGR